MLKRVGIIGYPVGHSISPAFQQAALDYYRLEATYELWQTEASQLQKVVEGLRLPSVMGANVTVPYKQDVVSLLDEIGEMAQAIGAVNTIVNRQGRLIGHNTDAAGFLKALTEDGAFDPKGKAAMLLGAGGSARAVGFALAMAGVGSLTIVNRTLGRAAELVGSLKAMLSRVSAISWDDASFQPLLGQSDLIVNCTPVGMRHTASEGDSPLKDAAIPSHGLVYDLVYNPPETALLREAASAGARTLGGLPMLVYQGAEAFELWTGLKAPINVMFAAAKKALRI